MKSQALLSYSHPWKGKLLISLMGLWFVLTTVVTQNTIMIRMTREHALITQDVLNLAANKVFGLKDGPAAESNGMKWDALKAIIEAMSRQLS